MSYQEDEEAPEVGSLSQGPRANSCLSKGANLAHTSDTKPYLRREPGPPFLWSSVGTPVQCGCFHGHPGVPRDIKALRSPAEKAVGPGHLPLISSPPGSPQPLLLSRFLLSASEA